MFIILSSLFILTLGSSSTRPATIPERLGSLRSRMISVAGTRDDREIESPLDKIILEGRLSAWLESNGECTGTEACLEYYASLKSPKLLNKLVDEVIVPAEEKLKHEYALNEIERLDFEIESIEAEIEKTKSQYDELKLKKYIQKYISKILKTIGSCQSPPGSPQIKFVSSESFKMMRDGFNKMISEIENATTFEEVDIAYHHFMNYMKTVTIKEKVHPQIAWNACKHFYLSHYAEDARQISDSEIMDLETTLRLLRQQRGDLVYSRSVKKRSYP